MIRTNATPCPCGTLLCVGSKIKRKSGHVVGCICVGCQNAANYASGHRRQQGTHTKLGGQGQAPTNEDRARPYDVEIRLMPESKTGDQVPASWAKFITSDWFRHAIHQSRIAVPVGSGVLPAVAIDERYIVVDIGDPRKGKRA